MQMMLTYRPPQTSLRLGVSGMRVPHACHVNVLRPPLSALDWHALSLRRCSLRNEWGALALVVTVCMAWHYFSFWLTHQSDCGEHEYLRTRVNQDEDPTVE
jgi:hypothetical protein